MQDLMFLFEVTNRCQLSCLHCGKDNGDHSVSISLELFEHIVDQGIEYGLRRVHLSGGEPTLHPQFAGILSFVSSKRLTFSLNTNGWNFRRVSPLFKEFRCSLDEVVFSLDGAREETHDYIRGRGSYQQLMEAIHICREERFPFALQMVLNAQNHGEIEEMCLLAARLVPTYVRFMELWPTPEAARLGLDLPPEKYVEIGGQVARLAQAFRFPVIMAVGSHTMSRWFPCPSQYMEVFTIDTWGNLGLCSVLTQRAGGIPGTEVAGNLAEMSFAEAHRRLIRLIARFQEDKATAIEKGTVDSRDLYFPCWYCSKYFHKADWVADFPDHPWANEVDEHIKTAPLA